MADLGSIKAIMAPIHRAGWPFIALFLAVSVVLGLLWAPLFWLGLLATDWCASFFRDPPRVTPTDPTLVTSPADGVVCSVKPRTPPPELELGATPLPCVGIFMNVFDVHVNRTPVPGAVAVKAYHKGRFVNASLDKASDENERLAWRLDLEDGRRVGLVQIAGLVARRIVAFAEPGQRLGAGERIGLIRFGSRCDIYLPEMIVPEVLEGQRALAGETVLARLDAPQTQRQGRRQ